MERSSEPNNSMPRLALRFVAGTVGLSRLAEWMAARAGTWTGLLWVWRPQQQSLGVRAISCPIGAPMGCEYFHMPMSFLLGDYVGVFPSWKKVLLKELAA
jgi:hypothetical protein